MTRHTQLSAAFVAVMLIVCTRQAVVAQQAALGITMSDNTRGGVLITGVVGRSPAAAIGLKSGDRIMAVGGKPVATYVDVVRLIATYKPSDRIELTIDRAGWRKTIPVVLRDMRQVMAGSVTPPAAAPPVTAVRPGSLLVPQYIQDLQNETPADIDDQHGFGG